jgi:stress response protein SCP2
MAISNCSSFDAKPLPLKLGEKLYLNKLALKQVKVAVGCDSSELRLNLDTMIFLLQGGKVHDARDLVNHSGNGNTSHYSGAVVHKSCPSPSQWFAKEQNSEEIFIELDKIPKHIDEVAVAASLCEGLGHLPNLNDTHVSLEFPDCTGNTKVLHFGVTGAAPTDNGMVLVRFCRQDNCWTIEAVGEGRTGGLTGLCKSYGLDVR